MTASRSGLCGGLGLPDGKFSAIYPAGTFGRDAGTSSPLSPRSAPPPGNLLSGAPPSLGKTTRIVSGQSSLGTIKVEHARTFESRVGQRLNSSGTLSIPVIESGRTRCRSLNPGKFVRQLSQRRPLPNDEGRKRNRG